MSCVIEKQARDLICSLCWIPYELCDICKLFNLYNAVSLSENFTEIVPTSDRLLCEVNDLMRVKNAWHSAWNSKYAHILTKTIIHFI